MRRRPVRNQSWKECVRRRGQKPLSCSEACTTSLRCGWARFISIDRTFPTSAEHLQDLPRFAFVPCSLQCGGTRSKGLARCHPNIVNVQDVPPSRPGSPGAQFFRALKPQTIAYGLTPARAPPRCQMRTTAHSDPFLITIEFSHPSHVLGARVQGLLDQRGVSRICSGRLRPRPASPTFRKCLSWELFIVFRWELRVIRNRPRWLALRRRIYHLSESAVHILFPVLI